MADKEVEQDGPGRRLLSVFRAAGCPGIDDWTGEELDWMWEADASKVFLQWLCHRMGGQEMVLTPDEVAQWEEMHRTRPEDILEGELLQEAVEACQRDSASGVESMSEEALREKVAEVQDELSLQTARMDQLSHISNTLSGRQAKQALQLGRLQEPLTENELRSRQEAVLQNNEKYNAAIKTMGEETEAVLEVLKSIEAKEEDKWFLSSKELEKLDEEEKKLLQIVEDLAIIQFPAEGAGRVGEFTTSQEAAIGQEMARLKTAVQESETERLLTMAKLAGKKAANDSIDKDMHNLSQGNFPSAPFQFESAAVEQEKKIATLESDISTATGEKLNKLAEKMANVECNRIHAFDLKAKVYRQLQDLDRLQILLHALLDQRSRQCVVSYLVEEELDGLRELKRKVDQLDEHCANVKSRLDQQESCIQRLRSFENEKTKDVVQSSDYVLRTIMKILLDKDVDHVGIITHNDCLAAAKNLIDTAKDKSTEKESKQKELTDNLNVFEREIPKLKNFLHLESGKKAELSPRDVATRIDELQSGIRHFELSLKERLTCWEKEVKSLKQCPHTCTQKRLWTDFLTNGKLLEANVDAMIKKSTK